MTETACDLPGLKYLPSVPFQEKLADLRKHKGWRAPQSRSALAARGPCRPLDCEPFGRRGGPLAATVAAVVLVVIAEVAVARIY